MHKMNFSKSQAQKQQQSHAKECCQGRVLSTKIAFTDQKQLENCQTIYLINQLLLEVVVNLITLIRVVGQELAHHSCRYYKVQAEQQPIQIQIQHTKRMHIMKIIKLDQVLVVQVVPWEVDITLKYTNTLDQEESVAALEESPVVDLDP